MNRITKLAILVMLALTAINIGVLIYSGQSKNLVAQLRNKYLPCQQPIYYSIGAFDDKFGISKADFIKAIDEAGQIWGKPINKDLFTYATSGSLKINLIYDYRQAATVKLQKLGLQIHDDSASYDKIKATYTSLMKNYLSQKNAFTASIRDFATRQNKYDTEVTYWNDRGGAPTDVLKRLQQDKAILDQDYAQLKQTQISLNQQADNIDALVVVINRLAASLNLVATNINQIGKTTGGEFDEGTYQNGPNGAEINIYQFDDRDKLRRVLAHELGHALGLDHLNNPQAIMYKLNSGTNDKLTTDDLAALKKQCKIR